MKNRYLLLLGFLTGVLSSYLGIGGGVVIVPVLTVIFKYPIRKAVGTSLAALPLTALAGLVMHFFIRQTGISAMPIILISAGSIFGARAGVYLSQIIKGKYIKLGFAILLLYVGLKQFGLLTLTGTEGAIYDNWGFFILLGLMAGLCSALLGIGGGVVMVPALNMLLGYSIHEAIMISLAVIIPTSLIGTFFHSKNSNVDFLALKYIIPGAIIGALTGSMLSNVSSVVVIQKVLGVLLILLSIKMFVFCIRKTN